MIVENPQALENTPQKKLPEGLDNLLTGSNLLDVMAPKKPKKEERVVSFKATLKDQAIIEAGKEKHGANLTGVIRMALRRFAEAEGIQVAS